MALKEGMSVICLYPQFFAYRHVYDLHSINKYQQNEHFRLASIQCKYTQEKKSTYADKILFQALERKYIGL